MSKAFSASCTPCPGTGLPKCIDRCHVAPNDGIFWFNLQAWKNRSGIKHAWNSSLGSATSGIQVLSSYGKVCFTCHGRRYKCIQVPWYPVVLMAVATAPQKFTHWQSSHSGECQVTLAQRLQSFSQLALTSLGHTQGIPGIAAVGHTPVAETSCCHRSSQHWYK